MRLETYNVASHLTVKEIYPVLQNQFTKVALSGSAVQCPESRLSCCVVVVVETVE